MNGFDSERLCITMLENTQGEWQMDFTRFTRPAREFLGPFFGVRKADGSFATEVASQPPEMGARIFVSWPFGAEQSGWPSVEIVAKGEKLWGRESPNPARELYLRQRKIISDIAQGGVTTELATSFLQTIEPELRKVQRRDIEADPEGFKETCGGIGLSREPVYAIDGGIGWFLLLGPTEYLGLAEPIFDSHMSFYQVLNMSGTYVNTDFLLLKELSELFCSIDLAPHMSKED
jgi:hypothetical protein